MNRQNDDSTGLAIGAGVVIACLAAIALAVAAMVVVLCFILSIIALFAWNEPVRIGKFTMEPDTARAFIGRGVIGAVALPSFLLCAFVFFDAQVAWEYWPHYVLLGYVIGSIGLEILFAEEEEESTGPVRPAPPQPIAPPPAPKALPLPSPESFQFASWDDEEELR